MRFDRLTHKAQEAVQEAQSIAGKMNQQEITPEHLFLALLRQEEGVVASLLAKVGANVNGMVQTLEAELRRLPAVTGATAGQVFMSNALKKVFDQAFKEAESLKDEFVSTEHLLIALADTSGTKASEILRREGIAKNVIFKVLTDIRGPHRVTDQDPEGKYQALKKYARDLTELAKRGKLDPWLGGVTKSSA